MSLREILSVPFRHKLAIIVFGFAVGGVVVSHVIRTPDEYASTAKLLFENTRDSTINMLTGMGATTGLSSEVELLQSRGFAERVVDRLGVDLILYSERADNPIAELWYRYVPERPAGEPPAAYEVREAAIDRFGESLGVEPKLLASVIDVSYRAQSPEVAQRILNSVVALFLELDLEMRVGGVSLDLLSAETTALQSEFRAAENALREFKTSLGVVSYDEEYRLLLSRVYELENSLSIVQADIEASSAILRRIEDRIDTRGQAQEERLRLDAAVARRQYLRSEFRATEARLERLVQAEDELRALEQRAIELERTYQAYTANLDNARVVGTLTREDVANVSLMQAPTLMREPVGTSTTMILAAGMMLAVVGGIALSFGLNALDPTLRSTAAIERAVDVPVLSSLGRVRSPRRRGRARPRTRGGSRKPLSGGAFEVASAWLKSNEEWRRGIETVRDHIRVAARGRANGTYVVAVTGAQTDAGASMVAASLAVVVAGVEGRNALLVVADDAPNGETPASSNGLTAPSLYALSPRYRTSTSGGPARRIRSGATVRQVKTDDTQIPIDGILPVVTDEKYSLIVVDLPPIGEGMLSGSVVSRADGVVLVIDAERNHREQVRRTAERLGRLKADLLGVVLNKRRNVLPRWLYRVT